MDTTTSSDHPPASTGRVAAPEVTELLQLRRRPAAVAAGAVVLLGLVLTLALPDVVPANAVVGLVVGLLAVAGGVVLAVLIDGRDPILRGPRHLRRDGHAVLGRMAGPDVALHGGEVLDALERRIDSVDRLRVVLTGTGADPSELAIALGRGAAARGHTSLVIDLRAASAPGVAEVGAGVVKLGEAARLADDRPYAWISAGSDRVTGAEAAVGVATRPPRDLRLLLIVAPDVATQVPALLETCERTLVLVPADTEQRSMVTARLDALRRAGARPEAIVVGGVAVAAAAPADVIADEGDDEEPSAFDDRTEAATPIAPFAPVDPPLARRTPEAPEVPVAPEAPVAPTAADDVTEPHADADDTADGADDIDDAPQAASAPPAPLPLPPPPAPRAASSGGPSPTPGPVADRIETDAGDDGDAGRTTPPAPSAAAPAVASPFSAAAAASTGRSAPAARPSSPPRPAAPAARGARDDWDLRSIRPSVTTTAVGDVEVGGMTATDPLTTTAALEGLLGAAGRSDEG